MCFIARAGKDKKAQSRQLTSLQTAIRTGFRKNLRGWLRCLAQEQQFMLKKRKNFKRSRNCLAKY